MDGHHLQGCPMSFLEHDMILVTSLPFQRVRAVCLQSPQSGSGTDCGTDSRVVWGLVSFGDLTDVWLFHSKYAGLRVNALENTYDM